MEKKIYGVLIKTNTNSFEEKFLNFEIPKVEEVIFDRENSAIDGQILQELTPSFDGKHFCVSYHFVLAIKHSSWEQYKQEGKVVKLPVKI